MCRLEPVQGGWVGSKCLHGPARISIEGLGKGRQVLVVSTQMDLREPSLVAAHGLPSPLCAWGPTEVHRDRAELGGLFEHPQPLSSSKGKAPCTSSSAGQELCSCPALAVLGLKQPHANVLRLNRRPPVLKSRKANSSAAQAMPHNSPKSPQCDFTPSGA